MVTNPDEIKIISKEDLCKLVSEIWKLEKRIKKNNDINEDDKKSYDFLFDRIYSISKWCNLEILDYTWNKYISWMNWLDIVWTEHDASLYYDIIWETITPMIKIDWKIMQKSKIIIKTPDELEEDVDIKWQKEKTNDVKIWKVLLYTLVPLIVLLILWFIYYENILFRLIKLLFKH